MGSSTVTCLSPPHEVLAVLGVTGVEGEGVGAVTGAGVGAVTGAGVGAVAGAGVGAGPGAGTVAGVVVRGVAGSLLGVAACRSCAGAAATKVKRPNSMLLSKEGDKCVNICRQWYYLVIKYLFKMTLKDFAKRIFKLHIYAT